MEFPKTENWKYRAIRDVNSVLSLLTVLSEICPLTGLFQLAFDGVQQKIERVAELVEDRAVGRQVHAGLRLPNLCSVVNWAEVFQVQAAYEVNIEEQCLLYEMITMQTAQLQGSPLIYRSSSREKCAVCFQTAHSTRGNQVRCMFACNIFDVADEFVVGRLFILNGRCSCLIAVRVQISVLDVLTSEHSQKPRAARRESDVFGDRIVGGLPVVQAEAAPEAHHVVRCARVEEAGAREGFWLQERRTLSGKRLLTPGVCIERVDSVLGGQVILEFGRDAD